MDKTPQKVTKGPNRQEAECKGREKDIYKLKESMPSMLPVLSQDLLMPIPISDSNGTRTHNHLLRKRTLNHLAKLVRCCYLNFRYRVCFEQGVP